MKAFFVFLALVILVGSVSVVIIAIEILPSTRFNCTLVGIIYTLGMIFSLLCWDKYTKIK